MDDKTKQKQLQAPFEEQDIEWRVQKSGLNNQGKSWAMVVPYITNRAITKRLDDVFGLFGWEDAYKPAPPTTDKNGKVTNNWLCGITLHGEERSVTKWDGAEETNIEPFKGGLSGSEKRTGAKCGIGRYLYQLEPRFAVCVVVNSRRDCNDEYPNYDSIKDKKSGAYTNFAWANPPLPAWALPGADFTEFLLPIQIAGYMIDLRKAFETAYKQAESSGDSDHTEEAIQAKDKRKLEIEQMLVAEAEKNLITVNDWLNNQIKSLANVPNESAVTALAGTIELALIDKMKAFKLDHKPLLTSFKKSCTLRIQQLKHPGAQ